MEKIGLLLDSTTLTREEIKNKAYLKVAPLGVTIDGENFSEFDLTYEQMVHHVHHAKKMLTSQPSPGVFLDLYKQFYEEGFTHILVVTLSEKISGTFQSALLAKSMVDFQLEISIHAAKVASFGVANGIPLIEKMIEDGSPFETIIEETQRIYQNAEVMFTLQNLMHLFHGGRLNRVSALLGTVLRIKPIIEMIDGKLELTKKERTNNACYEYFMNAIEDKVTKFSDVYVDFIELNRLEFAERFVEEAKTRFPNIHVHVTHTISPVFSVHLGDAGFGIAIVALSEK